MLSDNAIEKLERQWRSLDGKIDYILLHTDEYDEDFWQNKWSKIVNKWASIINEIYEGKYEAIRP